MMQGAARFQAPKGMCSRLAAEKMQSEIFYLHARVDTENASNG